MKCTDEKRFISDNKDKPINKYLINSIYSKNKNGGVSLNLPVFKQFVAE